MLISDANVPRRGNTLTRFSSARRLIASRTGVRPISSSRPIRSSSIGAPGAMRSVTSRSRSSWYARSASKPRAAPPRASETTDISVTVWEFICGASDRQGAFWVIPLYRAAGGWGTLHVAPEDDHPERDGAERRGERERRAVAGGLGERATAGGARDLASRPRRVHERECVPLAHAVRVGGVGEHRHGRSPERPERHRLEHDLDGEEQRGVRKREQEQGHRGGAQPDAQGE